MSTKKPVLLAILDGWGSGEETPTNAVTMANTPNMDAWTEEYPSTVLAAHNGSVGLPEGQMGNSEVGHLNIGAGRVVYQDFTRINLAIKNGDYLKNNVLVETIDTVKRNKKALHFFGLVSDGGVHSHINHLTAFIEMTASKGLEKVFVHAFMDGRDTPPKSGFRYLEQLQKEINRIGCGKVATVSGRYYAMDRDNRWKRVQLAWQALVEGKGVTAADPVQAVIDAYDRDETDEFIKPIVIQENNQPVATVSDGDAVIFFNFRSDRARQLTKAFTKANFDGFEYNSRPQLSKFAIMTDYDKTFDLPIVFPPLSLTHILGEEVSQNGMRQLRIAETEKYAHVTFFFNGGREEPYPLEERILIPSPQEVATYDEKPEMSAYLVTEALLEKLEENENDLIVLNFANGDMVAHSGILAAVIKACEAVDSCLEKLVRKVRELGGTVMITSDHGNADMMWDEKAQQPYTAHTLNPVPFILINDSYKGYSLRTGGALKDIAPTVLEFLGIPVPAEMEGESLVIDSVKC